MDPVRSRPRSCLPRCLLWSGLLLPLAAAWTLHSAAPAAEPAANGRRGKGGNPEGAPLRRTLPATVKVERDLVYARYGSREVMLDLYLPRQPASDRIPCIVAIHGGG